MKSTRQNEILKIIREKSVGTHEELIEELQNRGISVTQATVSRDIKELRLIKLPLANGSAYAVSAKDEVNTETMFKESIKSIEYAMNLVVIKTHPGMAGGIAASVDSFFGNRILGSVAGDDTLLVVTRNEAEANKVSEQAKALFGYMGE